MTTALALVGPILAGLTLAMGTLAGPARAAGACEDLASLRLPHVSITSVQVVGATPALTPAAPALPAVCRVLGVARPTADSQIRFEVAIPENGAWNGRYLQVGNGGFAGEIPERTMAMGLAAGFAVAGTDDGHPSADGTDASWALGHPEKVVDFGYRALKETTDAAKAIIRAYAGKAPRYSYFAGCSDGGREALMEVQRYPGDFDGVVAGDPANHWTHLLADAAWNVQALEAPGGYVGAAKLKAIEAAALKACGDQDGVIENPLTCRFDPAVLRCSGAETDQCLTDAQIATLRRIYGGAVDPKTGKRVLWGFDPGGEAEPGGWATWITGTGPGAAGHALQYRFGDNFFKYVQFADPNYPFPKLDFDADVAATDAKYAGILNAYAPDLGAFRKHGGKLIQYHGWADPAIPPRDSIEYFGRVQARMGDTADFYRLFLAPGMLHCSGGAGPNVLPTLQAITAWVEQGKAPDVLVATKYRSDSPALGVERTRPLCAYPKLAQWDGKGERDRAESWRCAAPPPPPA
ncbi:MAG: tannase/feruloyl esterase family alpha/beta hydrolase [Caulobacteraceae bacterium]|nr:tannase/feruloyl esterase family alpha/beta hydrolase [Caulobacteraceae bacterium]